MASRPNGFNEFRPDTLDTFALPKMDMTFVTSSFAYQAMLANPEVHLHGFNELPPNEIGEVLKFTRQTLIEVMQNDPVVGESELIDKLERTLLQDLEDTKAENAPRNEKRTAEANDGAVGDPQ
nr:expressed protein [Hymenolepis microstoma]